MRSLTLVLKLVLQNLPEAEGLCFGACKKQQTQTLLKRLQQLSWRREVSHCQSARRIVSHAALEPTNSIYLRAALRGDLFAQPPPLWKQVSTRCWALLGKRLFLTKSRRCQPHKHVPGWNRARKGGQEPLKNACMIQSIVQSYTGNIPSNPTCTIFPFWSIYSQGHNG